uniref:G_PROTEIN_RECEP_F1_2 domain-containing protein n=1 Tax=Rhabditophanes sp. KR3021 TaxID=114890 RepID=A0AC35TN91_9BILA
MLAIYYLNIPSTMNVKIYISILSLTSSLIGNFLCIYLVSLMKKNMVFSQYQKVMYFQFGIDIIYSLSAFILKMESVLLDSYHIFYLYYSDWFALTPNLSRILVTFNLYMLYTNIGFSCTCFIYRCLLSNNSLTKKYVKNNVVLIYGITFIWPVLILLLFNYSYDSKIGVHFMYEYNLEYNIVDSIITATSITLAWDFWTPQYLATICVSVGYVGTIYSIVFIRMFQYAKHFSNISKNMSTKTKKLHMELTKILFFCTCMPIALCGTPLMIYIALIPTKLEIVTNLGSYVVLLASFCPAMNSIGFIMLSSNNRRVIKKILTNKSTHTR